MLDRIRVDRSVWPNYAGSFGGVPGDNFCQLGANPADKRGLDVAANCTATAHHSLSSLSMLCAVGVGSVFSAALSVLCFLVRSVLCFAERLWAWGRLLCGRADMRR